MKKLICLLMLPLFSLFFLVGCGEDKTQKDLQVLYEAMVNDFVEDDKNIFFSDKENPNSLNIAYNDEVSDAINNVVLTTSVHKRYGAIKHQGEILPYIFNYYENHADDFYRIMSSAKYSNVDMNNLYASLESLRSTLGQFKNSYKSFLDAGVANIMEFNLTNYSYELNKVIDSAFNFMYKFAYMFETYCVEDKTKINETNLQLSIDKSYLDIGYVIYLENFKAFDYSVGSKGLCDLLPLMDNYNEFNHLPDISAPKKLSSSVKSNLKDTDPLYQEVDALLKNYLYTKEVFDQRFNNYKQIYNDNDMYSLTQYKFNQNGVSYSDYLASLGNSESASLVMLENFINNTYVDLVDKLSLIIE